MNYNIPYPLLEVKYHLLAAKSDIPPQELKISATADEGTIMEICHKRFPIEGIHFHPESIKMKSHGMQILKNFLELKKFFIHPIYQSMLKLWI
jgi:anthranilate synthase component 2